MQKYLRGIYYRFALYWKASDIEETGLEDVRGTVYIENAVLYNYDDRQVCTESISDDIIFMARVVKRKRMKVKILHRRLKSLKGFIFCY